MVIRLRNVDVLQYTVLFKLLRKPKCVNNKIRIQIDEVRAYPQTREMYQVTGRDWNNILLFIRFSDSLTLTEGLQKK